MIRHLLTAAMLAVTVGLCVPPQADAQQIPAQHTQAIAINAPGATLWPVPALENGALLSLNVINITNSATVAVSHIQRVSATRYITNTVEAALAGDTLTFYKTEYQPAYTQYYSTNNLILTASSAAVKPVWLIPGDYLSFTLSATNSAATAVIRAGTPGN